MVGRGAKVVASDSDWRDAGYMEYLHRLLTGMFIR